ncbi:MAG: lamin tail domain-containing protein [bacterium]|nr:lamin tail domain-containing protein [bacterium]MBP7483496.1 lamin tail domain-containing protein [Lacunisphaera sp.]
MKKFAIVLVILAMAAPAFAVSSNVRISQVYGAGGNAGAVYNQDFVELFNASGFDVDISGWVIEYGSATGTWGSSATNYFVFPAGSWIAGCSYVLVATGPASATVGAPVPTTPDYVQLTGPNLSGSNGKVGLFTVLNPSTPCGSETPGTLVDKLAYGTATCAEGTATAALTATTGAVRGGGGTVDTDNNLADFALIASPVPHNRATPAQACAPVATETETFGAIKAIFR